MAKLKLLSLAFTILYLSALSTARISVPLSVQPKNVINDVTASDRVSKPSFKRSVLLPTPDHEPADQLLNVELQPQVFVQHKHNDQNKFDVERTKFDNHLNNDHKASDAIALELEMERPNHVTQFKSREHGVSDDQDIAMTEPHDSEPHDSDQDVALKEDHESDRDIPVVSENTFSIETLHLNPSNYFRIRPINRHFRVKPSLFRIHRCRHHHMNHAYQNSHQVPYGNDMILAGQSKERLDPSTFHINTQSDPDKRPVIRRNHQRGEEKNMMMRRPFRQYIARQKLKKKVEEEIQKRKEMDARKQGGFMKSFRKFLNQF